MLSDCNVLRAMQALSLFSNFQVMDYYNLQVTGEDAEKALSDPQISVSPLGAEPSLHPGWWDSPALPSSYCDSFPPSGMAMAAPRDAGDADRPCDGCLLLVGRSAHLSLSSVPRAGYPTSCVHDAYLLPWRVNGGRLSEL